MPQAEFTIPEELTNAWRQAKEEVRLLEAENLEEVRAMPQAAYDPSTPEYRDNHPILMARWEKLGAAHQAEREAGFKIIIAQADAYMQNPPESFFVFDNTQLFSRCHERSAERQTFEGRLMSWFTVWDKDKIDAKVGDRIVDRGGIVEKRRLFILVEVGRSYRGVLIDDDYKGGYGPGGRERSDPTCQDPAESQHQPLP